MLGKNNPSNTVENSSLVGTNAGQISFKKSDEKPCIWCDYCNKPRHSCETYQKIHGKPANWKGLHEGQFHRSSIAHEAESVPFDKELMDHLLKLLKSNFGLSGISNSSLAQVCNE